MRRAVNDIYMRDHLGKEKKEGWESEIRIIFVCFTSTDYTSVSLSLYIYLENICRNKHHERIIHLI